MFKWMPESLMSHLQEDIEPSKSYVDNCNQCVDQFIRYLYDIDDKQYRPRKILKGGSMEKGTEIKNMSDIELVVVMSDDGSDIEFQRERAIKYLKDYLTLYPSCTDDGRTLSAVKIKLYSETGEIVDVDVLPTFIDIEDSEIRLEDIYNRMATEKRFRQTASAALTPLQRDFVKYKPSQLKQLIRVVKYWRKTCLKETFGKRYSTSYLLELITICAWEDAGSPETFDLKQGLYHVMNSMKHYKDLQRVWHVNYDKEHIDRAGVSNEYYVIDPANPYDNMIFRCNAWDDVERQVGMFLGADLFKDMSPHPNWQNQ